MAVYILDYGAGNVRSVVAQPWTELENRRQARKEWSSQMLFLAHCFCSTIYFSRYFCTIDSIRCAWISFQILMAQFLAHDEACWSFHGFVVPRRGKKHEENNKNQRGCLKVLPAKVSQFFCKFFALNAQILHVCIFPGINIPSCRLTWISPWFGSQIHRHWLTDTRVSKTPPP